jgi:hypothetical protein
VTKGTKEEERLRTDTRDRAKRRPDRRRDPILSAQARGHPTAAARGWSRILHKPSSDPIRTTIIGSPAHLGGMARPYVSSRIASISTATDRSSCRPRPSFGDPCVQANGGFVGQDHGHLAVRGVGPEVHGPSLDVSDQGICLLPPLPVAFRA